jgi:branched-chain amino acid transport system substrate-binding protein
MGRAGYFERNRRDFIKETSALLGTAALPVGAAAAQSASPVRVGLMLPYSGTFAQLGRSLLNGFKLAVDERGGKLSGYPIEYVSVDDESNPAKAAENAKRLIQRDNAHVLFGTAHSGVAIGMAKVARETGVPWLIPLATADELTGVLCAPNIFRTSMSSWQSIYPLGRVMKERGHKTAAFITWKYTSGEQQLAAFKEGFEKEGGKIVRELFLPFPQVEFQALLTEIASVKPDAVVAFFGAAAAAKFLKDYDGAGLKQSIPLYGAGFLTEGVLEAAGDAAEGVETTLNYGDGLDTKKNNAFRLAYAKAYKLQPDVFAVQGYDAAQLLEAGLAASRQGIADRDAVIRGMEKARIDSPRGIFTMSRAHNPIQDIYLRKVVGKENRIIGIATRGLADPARGCKLASGL